MLRWLTAGESHGPELVAILEGLPAGVPITGAAIQDDLARRRLGAGRCRPLGEGGLCPGEGGGARGQRFPFQRHEPKLCALEVGQLQNVLFGFALRGSKACCQHQHR